MPEHEGDEAMTIRKRVAVADDPDKALIKGIAMDIGKEVATYIERMYPQAVSATSSTFLLAVRNKVYNEIMAAMQVTGEAEILAWLADRKKARRELKAMWKASQETDWEHFREKAARDGMSTDDRLAALRHINQRTLAELGEDD
jgi:hypothetical protein